MTAALTVNDLTRTYGKRRAVDSLSIEVLEGDVYGFLGPNGAGKTTAMRCILGLIRRDSGTVAMFGDQDPVRQRRGVAAIIETPAFHDTMTATENLRQAGWYTGLVGATLDAEITRVLQRVELSDRATEKVSGYSLGMRQRLAIARCLLARPKMLFLDEPTNGLDPAGMKDMRDLIRSLALHDKITIVISSHLLTEVQAICNRVGIIDKGHMRAEGTVADLLRTADLPTLRLRAADLSALETTLRAMDDITIGPAADDGITVLTAVAPAEINRRLFAAGIALDHLVRVERTLEDVFIEVVR